MNTDFHAGLFTAVMMEGARFAVGPTIVARRSAIDALGGIECVKDYLAEDFMLGRLASDSHRSPLLAVRGGASHRQ